MEVASPAMRQIYFGALGALLLIVGCKSKDDAAGTAPAPSASVATKTGALEVKWVGKRFSIEGERARGNFVVPSRPEDSNGLTVRSYLYDFPSGTKATFGGKTESVKEGKPLVQEASFADKIANLKLDDIQRKRVELEIPLTISYPGRGELKLKVPGLRIAHAVAHELTKAEKEPVKFPGEKADSGPLDTVGIVRVRSRSRRLRVLGEGKLLSDIDWVAIERTHGDPRKVECPRPGKKPRVLKLTDVEVAVFERLTAKPVETKVFEAKADCTPLAKGPQDHKKLGAAPQTQREEIDTWLRAKLGLPEPPKDATPAAAKPPVEKALAPAKPPAGQAAQPAPAPKPAAPAAAAADSK